MSLNFQVNCKLSRLRVHSLYQHVSFLSLLLFATFYISFVQCITRQLRARRALSRPKKKKISGATFHIPLTKSATLNRLLHCSLWQFSGALFAFWGGEIAQSPCVIFSLALSIFKDVPLRTRRALSLYKVYGDSTLLVLIKTSLNSDSALLALNWRTISCHIALLCQDEESLCQFIQLLFFFHRSKSFFLCVAYRENNPTIAPYWNAILKVDHVLYSIHQCHQPHNDCALHGKREL